MAAKKAAIRNMPAGQYQETVIEISREYSPIRRCHFSLSGKYLAIECTSHSEVWIVNQKEFKRVIDEFDQLDACDHIAFSPCSTYLAACDNAFATVFKLDNDKIDSKRVF